MYSLVKFALISFLTLSLLLVTAFAQGDPIPASSAVSGQKLGSVLVYNFYTARTNEETDISLTNTNATDGVAVHLFFVNGTTNQAADTFVTLAPRQTVSLLASNTDPGNAGYVVAVAVHTTSGCPISFNYLSGGAYLKLASGLMTSLPAEAFAALYGGALGTCNAGSTTATLAFDGSSYNEAPRALALDSVMSLGDSNTTLLVLNRLGGNFVFGSTAAALGASEGVLYDHAEPPTAFNFSFSASNTQFRSFFSHNTFPIVPDGFNNVIPAGTSGWMKLWPTNDAGVLGALLNFNPNASFSPQSYSGGHNLRYLTIGSSATLTIPIYPPSLKADLSLGLAHTGSFTVGATGNYTLDVSNAVVAKPATGTIKITDTLPGNLTLQSFSGAGWNCTGTGTANVSCTNSSGLAAGASLPTLTLTVNVGAGTPGSITNTATVSVAPQQESNLTNNSASDTFTFCVMNPVVANNNNSGPGSLRAAIALACDGSTITFASSVSSPITLAGTQLVIDKNLTIQGQGANLLTISGNHASRVFLVPGGVTATISGLTITGGEAQTNSGGGISSNSTLTVSQCTISGNAATTGGGIFSNGVLIVSQSTISGNTTTFTGGGIRNDGGTATVSQSTISGNAAPSTGGGILNNSGGLLTLSQSTIFGNSTTILGGGIDSAGIVNAQSTIIALNTAPTSPDFFGTLTTQGFNLLGNNAGTTFAPLATDQVNLNPLLGPLAFNGGPTRTHSLLSSSPALDQGLATSATDQRSSTRTIDLPSLANAAGGDGSDIGAFEAQTLPNTAPTITAAGPLSRQQGSTATNSQIATVSDADQTANTLTVTAAQSTGSGVTVSNITINAAGQVFADVATICAATNSMFTLTVSDNQSATTTATLTVNVTANMPPTLGAYPNTSVNAGSNTTVTPNAAPTDNGTLSIIASAPGFMGSFSVNPATGVVTVNTPGPAGYYIVTVTATDNCGLTVSKTFSLFVNCPGATITVTTTADTVAADGACSLREAIQAANTNTAVNECPAGKPGLDTIYFAIGTSTPTINVMGSALPTITEPVVIDGAACQSTRVELNGAGAGASANGLAITAGNSTIRNLVINRFKQSGIWLQTGGGNTIQRCLIGTNTAGTAALGNGINGVLIDNSPNNIIGGAGASNCISGNSLNGVMIVNSGASGNQVLGNYIGTNFSGTAAVANLGDGVRVVFSANNNFIGGAAANAGNRISGNAHFGLFLATDNNQVQGNRIGTTADGVTALPNNESGILLIGSNNLIGGVGAGNLISGNGGIGVFIPGSNNTVQGNLIGTNGTGTGALGNSLGGVLISGSASSGNTLGGTAAGAGNTIAFNQTRGVAVFSGPGNRITGNSIFSNAGLGIDLGIIGVTVNDTGDGDTGPNNQQNFPVLTQATTAQIQGTLNSTVNTTFTIQFFSNPVCDPSGNGEGQSFVGQTTVTTNASGNGTISFTPAGSLALFAFITATATDPNGNTSEFSACRLVLQPTLSINDVTVTEGNTGTVNAVFTVSLSGASAQIITMQFNTMGVTATSPSDYTATSGTLTFPPNTLTQTITVQVKGDTTIESHETFYVNLSNPTNATITDGQGLATILNDDCLTITLSPTSLPDGLTNTFYNQIITASPANNYNYAVTSGALPKGLLLDPSSGLLYGTPTASGSYSFMIKATNVANGCMVTKTYTLNVGCPLVTFVTKWGSLGTGNGQFNINDGVAVDITGNVYVADRHNNRVQKFDSNGNFLLKWGSFGTGNGQFNQLWDLAVDVLGNVYVADYDNHRIQKFDANGNFLLKWGSFGTGNGQFNRPWGIAVSAAGQVYVTDRLNNRVQKFDASGNYILQWGGFGAGNGQFSSPFGVEVSLTGDVYIVETGNQRVQKFDGNGNYLLKWGSSGTGDGQFLAPIGVGVNLAGQVFITDSNLHRVQQFDGYGNYLFKWGSLGTGDGQFNQPYGVSVNASGQIYIADSVNHRIQKFSLPLSPIANAGPDQTLTTTPGLPAPVTLNGTASTNPGGGPLTYQWREGMTVLGTGATLNVNLTVGTHTITLYATNQCLIPATDTVVIKVSVGPPGSG